MSAESLSSSETNSPDRTPLYLIYHELGPGRQPYSYHCATEEFERHLQLAGELRRAAHAGFRVPEITFDDGHQSQYSYALPLLEQYGAHAVFFVTAGWIAERKDYMKWSDLRDLHARGHQVQSHSWSHPMLTHCNDAELEKELSYSRRLIQDSLGAPVDAISIPNGRWDQRVVRACVAAGYRRIFTSDSWRDEEEQGGVRIFGRTNVAQSMTAPALKRLLRRGAWKMLHDAAARGKNRLRQAVGDRAYHRIWRIVSRADATK